MIKLRFAPLFFLISIIINIILILLSTKFNKIYIFKKHHIHKNNVPRIGGISIWINFLVFVLLIAKTTYSKYIFLYSTCVFFCGLYEDMFSTLKAKKRLLIIILISLHFIFVVDNSIIYDIGIANLPYFVAVIFTIFSISGVVNSFNIIDGLNGLSTGLAIINMFFINHITKIYNITYAYNISFIALSSIIGFFVINFFTGRIFLGDGGAYLIGFLISSLSILTYNQSDGISAWFFLNLAAYPVVDTLFSIYRRIFFTKRDIMKPDLLHFHTLLYKRLFKSHLKTTLTILIVSFFVSYFSYLVKDNTLYLILIFLLFCIVYFSFYFYLVKKITFNTNSHNKELNY